MGGKGDDTVGRKGPPLAEKGTAKATWVMVGCQAKGERNCEGTLEGKAAGGRLLKMGKLLTSRSRLASLVVQGVINENWVLWQPDKRD